MKILSVGPNRVALSALCFNIVNFSKAVMGTEYIRGERGNFVYTTPTWNDCIILSIRLSGGRELCIRYFLANIREIRKLSVCADLKGDVGGEELVRAGIFENNGEYPESVSNGMERNLIEVGIKLGLIKEEDDGVEDSFMKGMIF